MPSRPAVGGTATNRRPLAAGGIRKVGTEDKASKDTQAKAEKEKKVRFPRLKKLFGRS